MKTRVLRVDSSHPEEAAIAEAAALVRQGELVAFPTETVYGLGADALNAEAVRRVFEAKGRPANDPLIVHLASVEWLPRVVASIPSEVETLAARFWPGPLTLILPRAAAVPPEVTAGLATVAVRVPAHPVALALLRASDLPIAAPSANRFGGVSPTTADHVWQDLAGRIACILDAGPTPIGVESTVLDLSTRPPRILRPGGTPREALEAILGPVMVWEGATSGGAQPSPGLLPKHYAPRARLILVLGATAETLTARVVEIARALHAQGERVGVLLTDEDAQRVEALLPGVSLLALGSQTDLAEIARNLYAALRQLDAHGITAVVTRDFGGHGLGLAIRDRLRRAASEVVTISSES